MEQEQLFSFLFTILLILFVAFVVFAYGYYLYSNRDAIRQQKELESLLRVIDASEFYTRDNRMQVATLNAKEERTEKDEHLLKTLLYDTCFLYHRLGLLDGIKDFAKHFPQNTWSKETHEEITKRGDFITEAYECDSMELGDESIQQMSHAYYLYEHVNRSTAKLMTLINEKTRLETDPNDFQLKMVLYEICLILDENDIMPLYSSYRDKYNDDEYLYVIFRNVPYEIIKLLSDFYEGVITCSAKIPTPREKGLVNQIIRTLSSGDSSHLCETALKSYLSNSNYLENGYLAFRLYKDLEYDANAVDDVLLSCDE